MPLASIAAGRVCQWRGVGACRGRGLRDHQARRRRCDDRRRLRGGHHPDGRRRLRRLGRSMDGPPGRVADLHPTATSSRGRAPRSCGRGGRAGAARRPDASPRRAPRGVAVLAMRQVLSYQGRHEHAPGPRPRPALPAALIRADRRMSGVPQVVPPTATRRVPRGTHPSLQGGCGVRRAAPARRRGAGGTRCCRSGPSERMPSSRHTCARRPAVP